MFASALTLGPKKQTDLKCLEDSLHDLHELLIHGLTFKERVIPVSLRCVVADAPALAPIKQTNTWATMGVNGVPKKVNGIIRLPTRRHVT